MRTYISAKMKRAQCRHCQQWFWYEARKIQRRSRGGRSRKHRVTRCICDACQTSRRRWTRTQARPVVDLPTERGEFTSRADIAEKLGLSVPQVEEIEREALDRVRSSVELRAAYSCFKAAGKPKVSSIRQHIRRSIRERVCAQDEALMLDLLLEIMDWWKVHDLAVAEGLIEEAAQVREAIVESRRLLLKELGLDRS